MLAVVIPIYNEQENLPELSRRLAAACAKLQDMDWQVIYVNDGSRDESVRLIEAQHQADPRFTLVDLSRNWGHQAALAAGLKAAAERADAVMLMDGDLQDPPELIPQFVARWREGFEVVYAVRRKRKENVLKRAAYASFYRLLRSIAKVDIPLDSGDFCLIDGKVARVLVSLPEVNPFLRGLRSWVGFRQTGLEYERDRRFAGAPKYSFVKLMKLAMSGFVGFSSMPLRLASWLGFACAAGGFAVSLWVLMVTIFRIEAPRGWASQMAVVLFVGGVQMLLLGVLGEYLGNIYDEVRRRPLYIVRRRLDDGSGPSADP